jgi:hypothetical protein
MKQNEINAVKAARGLDTLTGAAAMQADAQIRLELLYERSAKAQGAFERGADTLVVQQEKLRATFVNLQAALGEQLIPAVSELFAELAPLIEDLTPAAVEVFRFLGEVLIRKMENGSTFEQALSTIYGVDLMQDNVDECRKRLLCGQTHLQHIVERNIVCHDALTYDYSFNGTDLNQDELTLQNLFEFG